MEGSGPAGMGWLTLGNIRLITIIWATPHERFAKRRAPLLKPGFEDIQGNARLADAREAHERSLRGEPRTHDAPVF